MGQILFKIIKMNSGRILGKSYINEPDIEKAISALYRDDISFAALINSVLDSNNADYLTARANRMKAEKELDNMLNQLNRDKK